MSFDGLHAHPNANKSTEHKVAAVLTHSAMAR